MWFGKNLRYLRKRAGLSQEAIGDLIGKKFTTVQRYEVGDNEPSLENASKLATFFNVSLREMCAIDLSIERKKSDVLPSSSYRFWDVGISAGAFEEIEGVTKLPTVDVPDELLGRWAGNRNIMFMRVNGESMNNVIEDGAIIAVLSEIERGQIKNGDIVVASIDRREYTVKRFFDVPEERCIILRPDSSDPSFRELVWNYDDEDGLYILGKVVIYQVYM